MKKIFKVIPFINKNNKQISIAIPKNKFKVFKKKLPKKLKMEIKEIEW
jgi:hypothetical protein